VGIAHGIYGSSEELQFIAQQLRLFRVLGTAGAAGNTVSVPAVTPVGPLQLSLSIQDFSRHNSFSFQIQFGSSSIGDLPSRGQSAKSWLQSAGARFSTGKTFPIKI
jgi:hypothetical protein